MPGKRQDGRVSKLSRPKKVIAFATPTRCYTRYKIDNRIWLQVTIAGIEYKALCDSGATTSFVSRTVAETLHKVGIARYSDTKTKIYVADGRMLHPLGKIQAPTTVEDKEIMAVYHIMPETKYQVILGIDILAQLNAVINVAAGKVYFNDTVQRNTETTYMTAIDDESGIQDKLRNFLDEEMIKFQTVKGKASDVEHVIRLKPGTTPIKQRYYPCNPNKQEIINKEIDKMLADGIIEPSNSPWSSPIVLVPKKNKEVRFCIDFRRINEVSIKDSYPLPYISGILDKLKGSKYFSTLDLKHGYWQLSLAKESRPITAFTAPGRGFFQFKVLAFGLHSAAATFQRYLDNIIGPELENIALVYLDDIIVLGRTWEEHINNLKAIFRRLQEAGLKIHPEKCHFAKQSIKYLGHIVSGKGIQTDPEKVEAIKNILPPRTKKEVRSFLGMTSWYRRFVPNFAQITTPLVHLTKKDKHWHWGDEQEQAFRKVKTALTKSPVLRCPDFNKPFQLHTDASNTGLGIALIQMEGSQERVVAYASRTLSKAEVKYSTTEKECLAVVWGIRKFRYYLEGYRFVVVTDHQCLRWLNELKKPSGRLARWAVDLQQYDFEVKYRRGQMNNLADSLSRAPLTSNGEEEEVYTVFGQTDCTWYNKKILDTTNSPESNKEYLVKDGILYRHFPGKSEEDESPWKLCIPKSDRKRILEEIHDSATAGHLGVTKSIARAAKWYYWPRMFEEIRRYVRKCILCKRHKYNQDKPLGHMYYRPISMPWEQVSTDLLGPFPRSKKGFTYLLVFQDKFTKWVECQPLRQATAAAIAKAYQDKIVFHFGTPRSVTADNGPQFASKLFKEAVQSLGTVIRFNAPYSPQTNSVERVNKVLGPMIAQYIQDDHREWDKYVQHLAFAINTAKHESTGYTPAYLNFGRELIPPNMARREAEGDPPTDRNYTHQDVAKNLTKLEDVYKLVRRKLDEAYQTQRRAYNLRRRPYSPKIGDEVYKKEYPLSNAAKHFSAKLAPKFSGPYRIKKIISPVIVLLQIPNSRRSERVHVKDIKVVGVDDTSGPTTS